MASRADTAQRLDLVAHRFKEAGDRIQLLATAVRQDLMDGLDACSVHGQSNRTTLLARDVAGVHKLLGVEFEELTKALISLVAPPRTVVHPNGRNPPGSSGDGPPGG